MLRKINILILLLLIPVFNLLSCSHQTTPSQEIITLRIATWASESESPQERKIFDAFERTHPNIKIKTVYTSWNYYSEKVLVLTVGGIAPDLIWNITTDLPSYASRNILTDLTDLVANDPSIDTSLYFPHALEICSYKGRLYALPRDVCCWFYTYNKRMFDEAKCPYPSPDWTWDDFLVMCKKLTKDKNGDGRLDQFGTWYYNMNDVVHQNGGSTFSPDGKENWTTNPEFYEAIQWWADLAVKHHVSPRPSEVTGFGGDLFQNEICATQITGPWMFAAYKKNVTFPWDIVNLPRGKAGNKACLLGLPISISKQTKHPKEAYELLKFLTYSVEAQSMQAKLGIATPSRQDLALSPVFTGQDIMPAHINLYLKSMLEYTYAPYMYTYTRRVEDQITSSMDLVNLGKITAKEALELKKPLIDKIMRKAIERENLLESTKGTK